MSFLESFRLKLTFSAKNKFIFRFDFHFNYMLTNKKLVNNILKIILLKILSEKNALQLLQKYN